MDKKTILAVAGASSNREKWGYKIYSRLKELGFKVYGINPKGGKFYPDLKSLPEKPDIVITATPPEATLEVVKECRDLGIKDVWMQPGSESQEAIKFCKENRINVVYNACFIVDGLEESF